MDITQAISYIHNLPKGLKPGLHRIRKLLSLLGDPQKQLKFVHIAGTNGKGSTAAMTASILTKAGYHTGLFTSPFIYRFHERIQLSGQQISDEDLLPLILKVKVLAETMEERPAQFEFVTAMAMEYYRSKKADIVVLEVGMGGDVDATNAIDCPEVAVITNIGLDHTDVLGGTLPEIAAHKAGIIKEGCHAVVYRGTEEVEAVFRRVCNAKNVPLTAADFDSIRVRSRSLTAQVFDCGQRKELYLPLLGEHQCFNASVVLSVVDALIQRGWKITEDHIRQGLREVTWPGRFDIVGRDPLFIIDGGHNPQCIDALVKNIEEYLTGRTVIGLVGVLADKDYGEMFRPVMDKVSCFVCITPDSPRRLTARELALHLQKAGAKAVPCDTVAQAVSEAKALAGKDGAVLCFGSLYSIGQIKGALEDAI